MIINEEFPVDTRNKRKNWSKERFEDKGQRKEELREKKRESDE
jgi:hypothetical protein